MENISDLAMAHTKSVGTFAELQKMIDEGENCGEAVNWDVDDFLSLMKIESQQCSILQPLRGSHIA